MGELKNILPEAKTFVVFGFFDFTSSQLEVLKSIKDAGYELIIYLPPLGELPTLRSEVMERSGSEISKSKRSLRHPNWRRA